MKRLICALLIVCCCCSVLVACNTEKDDTPSMNTIETSFDFDDRITEDEELTAKGYPPLPLEHQILWQDAHEMVEAFALCHFNTAGVTRQIGNTTYDVIVDQRFPYYNDLVTYLKRFFTHDFIFQNLLNDQSPVKASTDKLPCVVQASGSSNATYAGHVFTVDSYTINRIELTATVYYTKDGSAANKPFFETPKKPENYTTKEMKTVLVKTNDGWRFSECPYLRG